MDIYELLKMLHPDNQVQQMQSNYYTDEPIPKTSSPMQQPTPEKIREMRSISGLDEKGTRSMESLFYHQGLFMADFVDDFHEYEDFVRYYPTYQTLTDRQLRGYFTWRADVRRQKYEKAPTAYAFLYCYELINMIGFCQPMDAFLALKQFYAAYLPIEPALKRYVPRWIEDFVVSWQLSSELLQNDAFKQTEMKALSALDTESDVHSRFMKLCRMSTYQLGDSRFYLEHPALTELAVSYLFDMLSDDDVHLPDALLGEREVKVYHPFENAVYYAPSNAPDFVYECSMTRRFRRIKGNWYLECYGRADGKSVLISNMLRALDARLRLKMRFHYRIKSVDLPPEYLDVLDAAIDKAITDDKKRNQPHVDLDLSKLVRIRAASDVTREKLISDEEREEIAAAEEAVVRTHVPAREESDDGIPELSEQAKHLLQCVLNDEPVPDLTAARGVMLSVLVDEINEAFYPMIGDSVMEMDGIVPHLIEDYLEDVRAFF